MEVARGDPSPAKGEESDPREISARARWRDAAATRLTRWWIDGCQGRYQADLHDLARNW